MKRILSTLLLLGMTQALTACAAPLQYSAEPMEATVVDAETNQPLEGVIVVAHWELRFGHAGGSSVVGQLMVMEATTDKDGKFSLPAWGPKIAVASSLSNRAPQLLLFKNGYRYKSLWNDYTKSIEQLLQPVRKSDWNGKTIKMEKFKGTVEGYQKDISNLNDSLWFATNGDYPCEWKKLPQMIRAIYQQRKIFEAKGIQGLWSIDVKLASNEKYFFEHGCGSTQAFLEEIVK